ncbi:hypothetical protein SRIMM317S_06198 [Streptomyces rimosus subsp. rimosus]
MPKKAVPRELPRVWKKRTPVVATPSWWCGADCCTSTISWPSVWPNPAPSRRSSARTTHRSVSAPLAESSRVATAAQAVPLITAAFSDHPRAASRPVSRPEAAIPSAMGIMNRLAEVGAMPRAS